MTAPYFGRKRSGCSRRKRKPQPRREERAASHSTGAGPFPAMLWNHGSWGDPLFQAANDFALSPSKALAEAMKAAGKTV